MINTTPNYILIESKDYPIKKCYICGTTSSAILKNYIFETCNHYYCVYCLFRTIFKNNLKEIIDQNEITIKCKCTQGKKILSLKQIDDLIQNKSNIDEQQYGNMTKYCTNHSTNCDLFCKDCEKYICIHCKIEYEKEHLNHKIVSVPNYIRMYKEFIRGIPLKFKYSEDFKLQLDKSVDKFSKELAEKTSNAINRIIKIIEELNMIKNNYLTKLKEIQENGLESINLLKSFYFEYYHDLSNFEKDDDIFSLRYLAHIKSEINDFEMKYSMGIFNRLEEIQNQIKNLKSLTENPFSLKINFLDIPTTFREVIRTLGHDRAINCLSKIGDNQFISGSLDFTIKFWNLDDEELKPYEVLDKFIGKVGLLLFNDNKLYWASVNETWIKIYKIKENEHQNNSYISLEGHNGSPTSIILLDNNLLVTSAKDGQIILWDSIKNDKTEIFRIYERINDCEDGVYSLCNLKDGRFASGDAKGKIKLWKKNSIIKENDNKYYCYQIINENAQNNKIKCLILLNNNYLCSGDTEGSITIYRNVDNERYEMSWCKNLKEESITCLTQIKQGFLISGSFNINHSNQIFLRVWEPNKNGFEIKEVIKKHYRPIRSVIELDWGNIVSAGEDGVIIIWKSGVLFD